MLRDTPNPYLEWIIALHQGRPAVNLTDSGLHTPLVELGPIDPANQENAHWDLYHGLGPTLAARYGVTPAEVIPTLGTGGALFLVYAAHAQAGGAVLVEDPAYGPLLQVPQALGFRVDRFARLPDENYTVNPERVLSAVKPDTRLVAVTDLGNPTGLEAGDDALAVLAAELGNRGITLFVDEVYRDYRRGPVGTARVLGDTVVTASSLTKVYGFGSLRAGWILASPARVAALRRVTNLMHVEDPFPSLCYTVAVLDRIEEFRTSSLRRAAQGWNCFREWCVSREIPVPPTDGGICAWLPVPGEAAATTVAEALFRDHGVAVVPGRFFGDDGYLRIGLGTPTAVLERGLDGLGRTLDSLCLA